MTSDIEMLRRGVIRIICASRKRKLQKLGIICWWSSELDSWVWDAGDMADPQHMREDLLKHGNKKHRRRKP